MKKLIATVILLATSAANASDWVELQTSKQHTVYVDADRITYANKAQNLRKAWVKIKYNQPDNNTKIGEYIITNQVFDCENSKFMIKSMTQYKKDGAVKFSSLQQTGWMEAPPDSNLEYVQNSVCEYPYI